MTTIRTQTMSFRAEPDLAVRIEKRAARKGITVSAFLRAAVEHALGSPAGRLLRPEHETLLFQLLLGNRYLYRLLADRYGEEEVKANSASVKRDLAAEVRAIFEAIDQCEEG